jgi:Calcineurin-like phosphoesterase
MSVMTTTPVRRGRSLKDFVDLGRSSLHSHYRAHLADEDVAPSAPVYEKLKSFLNVQFVRRGLKFLRVFLSPRRKFPDYKYSDGDTGVFPLANDVEPNARTSGEVRLGLAGDWGTGTDEAEAVAEQMADFKPHYTIHLGDVYYMGDFAEVNEHCLNTRVAKYPYRTVAWPRGSVGSFALNGNHEMYANGKGYFDLFLPTLGLGCSRQQSPPLKRQSASFFCLKNDDWMLIGIDTGYNSVGWSSLFSLCKLENPLLNWLENVVRPKSFSGAIILLSHHQYFSAFDRGYDRPAKQLARVIGDRTVLWFWGHEHRFAVYGRYGDAGQVQAYGRCLGHGGMPVSRGVPNATSATPLVVYDDREYELLETTSIGFNGFANLTFIGKSLKVEYYSLASPLPKGRSLLITETWEARNGEPIGTGITKQNNSLSQVNPNLSAAQH